MIIQEHVRKVEFVREMQEMMDKVIDINGFVYNDVQDMISHASTIWELSHLLY